MPAYSQQIRVDPDVRFGAYYVRITLWFCGRNLTSGSDRRLISDFDQILLIKADRRLAAEIKQILMLGFDHKTVV